MSKTRLKTLRVGLNWYGLVWFCLRQHPSEASVKISSRFDLFWLFWRRFRVSLVLTGLKQHQSEGSVKVSAISDLFWLF